MPIFSLTTTVRDTIRTTDTLTVKDTINTKTTDTITDIRDGMIAYYNFDNGNLNDSSGYGNNIIFNNATPAADRFGNAGNAFSFDGSSSASLNPDAITIFAIVKVNGFYTGGCYGNQIVGKGNPDEVNGFYALRFNDPTVVNALACSTSAQTDKEFFYGLYGNNIPQGSDAGAGNDSFPYIP